MVEEKKLTHLQAVLKETYLSLMGSAEAKRFWKEWKEQEKAEKLRKKLLARQEKRRTAQKV